MLSGFGGGSQHLKLTTIMFQNIFPAIDINTVSTLFIFLILSDIFLNRRCSYYCVICSMKNQKDK